MWDKIKSISTIFFRTAAFIPFFAKLRARSTEIEAAGHSRVLNELAQTMERQPDLQNLDGSIRGETVFIDKFTITRQANLAAIGQKAEPIVKKDGLKSLNQDWSAHFIEGAQNNSDEYMQNLWAKILAGESHRPGGYSLRTLQTVKTLLPSEAKLFQRLCSMCFVRHSASGNMDVRVPSFWGDAATNKLEKYGFSYQSLSLLEQCGLVASMNSWCVYSNVFSSAATHAPFEFNQKVWLLKDELHKFDRGEPLKIYGVELTFVGKELLQVVDKEPIEEFAKDVEEGLMALGLAMIELPPEETVEYYRQVQTAQRTNNSGA